MIIYTDDVSFSRNCLNASLDFKKTNPDKTGIEIKMLIDEIFKQNPVYMVQSVEQNRNNKVIKSFESTWKYFFIIRHAFQSHYDLLTGFCRENIEIPDGILCLAGCGDSFHGFYNRPWASLPGNIHLVAYFKPNRKIENPGAGFTALAVVSTIQAIDRIAYLKDKAGIKWINDILIEGSKVGGVLAYSQSEGDIITGAVLGIGLNVEKKPNLGPNIFIPKTACLKDFSMSDDCSFSNVLADLLSSLNVNYRFLLQNGYPSLLDFYRKRSAIINRKVGIYSAAEIPDNKPLRTGKVAGIGENLELFLDDKEEPVISGRLAILD